MRKPARTAAAILLGEAQTTVTFLPRGAPVEGYRWARDPKTPDSACRF